MASIDEATDNIIQDARKRKIPTADIHELQTTKKKEVYFMELSYVII